MKINFDGQIFGLQKYGGISRYIIDLATSMKEGQSSHFCNILSFISINEYLKSSKYFNARISINKPIPKSTRIIHSLNVIFLFVVSNLARQEIIHLTFYSSLFSIFKPKCKKLVVTVYDFTDELDPSVNNPKAVKDKVATMQAADLIICISHNTQRDLNSLYPQYTGKSKVIHFGYSSLKNKVSNLSSLNLNSSKNYILFVGQRGRYKNFELLYRSYLELNKSDLSLVAFGPQPTKEEKNIYNKVEFISGNDELLAYYYSNAKCFIFPSSYEGFGIPSLEAMEMGCPIIVPNSSCFPEIVDEAGLYFECGNKKDLVSKINEILDNKKLRNSLILKGKKRYKEFTYDRCAKETIAAYEA